MSPILHISLSTACLYHFPLRRTLALAAEAGYDGIELVMGPEVWVRGSGHVASLSRECGLQVFAVHQALLCGSPWGRDAGRMVEALHTALELGCPRVVIHGPEAYRWAEPVAQRWLRILEECQKRTMGSATRLALENPGNRRKVLGQPELLENFARRYDLDITFDACHAGDQMIPAYMLLRGRMVNLHFSDLKPSFRHHRWPRLAYSLYVEHQMPGEGHLPLGELVAQIAADGYPGPISMEIGPLTLRSWSPGALRRRLAQALEYVRAATPQTSPGARAHPAPDPRRPAASQKSV